MEESLNQCPWSEYSTGNFPLCEEKICELVRQPANSYSNILFFLLGAYLIFLFVNKKSRHGLNFGIVLILLGMASFGAHATSTNLFGFLDFAAIFLVFSLFAGYNLIHSKILNVKSIFLSTSLFFIPTTLILYFFKSTREIIFALFIVGLLAWEAKLLKIAGKKFLTRQMKIILIVFSISVICLILDSTKTICNPQNHYFQLHMLWHLLNAVAIYYLARHLDEHH